MKAQLARLAITLVGLFGALVIFMSMELRLAFDRRVPGLRGRRLHRVGSRLPPARRHRDPPPRPGGPGPQLALRARARFSPCGRSCPRSGLMRGRSPLATVPVLRRPLIRPLADARGHLLPQGEKGNAPPLSAAPMQALLSAPGRGRVRGNPRTSALAPSPQDARPLLPLREKLSAERTDEGAAAIGRSASSEASPSPGCSATTLPLKGEGPRCGLHRPRTIPLPVCRIRANCA